MPLNRLIAGTLTAFLTLGVSFGNLAAANAASYARRPYVLVDQVKPGTSFFQFRERLRQAVRNRDAAFIRSIATPNIQLTFGRPRPLSTLNLDNPQAPAWKHLERALSTGCARYEAPPGTSSESWACPHVFQASLGDPFQDIYIVGSDVNVRSQPQMGSAVIDVLSHEVVKLDQAAFNAFSDAQRQAIATLSGWYPVITPQGKRGFVSTRYAFVPTGYRAIFARQSNSWKMTAFIAGD